jgi:hypothetical protein
MSSARRSKRTDEPVVMRDAFEAALRCRVRRSDDDAPVTLPVGRVEPGDLRKVLAGLDIARRQQEGAS